jgi:hypothetical protein
MTLLEIKVALAKHDAHTDPGATEGGLCNLCFCASWILEALEWLVAELEKKESL